MQKKGLTALVCLTAAAVSGCATYRGRPLTQAESKRVCIIENAKVSEWAAEFLPAFREALSAGGFEPEVIPDGSGKGACPVTARYNLQRNGGAAPQPAIKSARVDLYRDGQLADSAILQGKPGASVTPNAVAGAMVRRLFPKPVALTANHICIIDNPRVSGNADFLDKYRTVLERRGFSTAVLPPDSPLGACAVTSKYVAFWGWDLVPFLVSAKLDIYSDGMPAGSSMYSARHSRFVGPEEAIEGMVGRLFPK